ncbi:UTP--GlnB (protein PII) uridylyltransferase, GlnD [Thalassolituus maritimus]|uniref:Bifunctional uridylyltransferase/uridylyl-removing enzyme n=2 Tax=Thalassolituus TaxID=187492 RepID=A0A1N7Q7B0_9GAMM|nr:[protein-PII] uridylyltransferase [Thalassolituus maritimus]SIT18724.1 UTP--GlnB (protein PII) uridylyltransferase, GlnD [Thalassolituus maritimus]
MTDLSDMPVLPQVDEDALLEELKEKSLPLPVIKPLLTRIQNEAHHYFRETLDADLLVRHRATLIDRVLRALWRFRNIATQDIALIAVGGYGRAELHPHSDIDLLLLARDEDSINRHASDLQDFITLLWDIKLDIGHSVRTLDECVTEAEGDLTIITNLLESRTLIGDETLHSELRARITPEAQWPAAVFFEAKSEELNTRHDKHNSADYNLEPNVKNSPGALRDIQTITWVAIRHFGKGTLQALEDNGFLTEFEHKRLASSVSFLWEVRYALHMLAGREEDRLLFDLQTQVAEVLGYKDTGRQLGVERFMSQFYRHQLSTMELSDMLMMHFTEDYMQCDDDTITPVNEHFVLCNGYLQLTTPDLFEKEPAWLLRVFPMLAQISESKGIHSATIRALRDNRNLIDEEYRQNPEHNAIFMTLMRSRSRVVRELSRMMRYGILGRYIPSFGRVIGMMEYDLLHKYTVDEHTFRMIRLLRHFRYGDVRERFPIASRLIHKVHKKEVLYLAALLHDVGKSREGDHAANGGEIAEAFCIQHGLKPADTHMVTWLVSNHLLMSNASQRLDLSNPDDIHQFAVEVGDQYHLDMLFLISVADTHSTNPELWTPWRAEQMRELYRNTQAALRRGLENRLHKDDVIEEIQQEAIAQLQDYGLPEARAREIWGQPGEDYFLREGVDNIVWQTREIDAHGNSAKPLVSVRQTSDRQFEGATQIFLFMKDQPNLFAVTTATLDQLNLNIQDARIMTSESENNAVDTYIVLDENNEAITDPERIRVIRNTLCDALDEPEEFDTIIRRRTSRVLKQFDVPTQVTISNDPLMRRTVLEVTAADRPGLLARVGSILMDFGAQLQGAKILTEGEQVSDIFFIVDANGEPYSDPASCEELCKALEDGLDEQVEEQSAV